MYGKKTEAKFTIQFSRNDPAHLQVADILNRQKRYGKAQYIVDAVLHYINFGLTEAAMRPVRLDEKHIEAVVSRILGNRSINGAGGLPVLASASQVEKLLQTGSDVVLNDAIDAIGEDGLDAIASALDIFRRK